MENKNWTIIPLLGEPYIIEILESISPSPKRYLDFAKACPNETTRSDRLRKLEEAGIVKTSSLKAGKRSFVHYELSRKGRKIMEMASKIEEL